MVNWSKMLGFTLLSGGMMLAGLPSRLLAATSARRDIISDQAAAATVEIGRLKPIADPNWQGKQSPPSGNPLWAIPLAVMTATRERPIFSPSRRPQPDVVAPAVAQIRAPAPQKAAEPERPPLALVGAAVGGDDAIAVLLDRTNQKVVRLRQGESYAGWQLSAVLQREVTFRKADRTEVLALGPPGGPADAPGAPAVLVPARSTGTSFAPFVPRSTPKNGEPDGL